MGDGTKAAPLYDKAITLAREHGFIQEAALGYELAAKYHLAAGSHRSFERYMTKAVHCYASWGAKTKVACLVKHYPQLLLQEGENNVFAIPAVPDSGSV